MKEPSQTEKDIAAALNPPKTEWTAEAGSCAAPCSPFPLPISEFEQVLKSTGLVDAAAIEDPHGFDNFATQAAIYQAWAQLHGIIVANACQQAPKPEPQDDES